MATRIDYEGSPAFVGVLAACLRDEGLEVAYDPPVDLRGEGDDSVEAVLRICAGQALDVLIGSKIERAIERFWQRSPRARLKVTIEDAERA